MKRQNQLNIKRGLLSKLVLLVALFLGSSNVWGEDIIYFSNTSSTLTGWTASNITAYSYSPYYLYTNGNGTLTSNSPIMLAENRKLVISAKRYIGTSADPSIAVKYSSDGETWSTIESPYTTVLETDNYVDLEVDLTGTYYIKLECYKIRIQTLKLSINDPYPAPTNFIVSDYTPTTVTLGWTRGNTETSWVIKYSTEADFDPDTEGLEINYDYDGSYSYLISGLISGTKYYAYIRSKLGTNWSSKLDFLVGSKFTVNDDSSENNTAPIPNKTSYDGLTKSQYVIPAALLESIKGEYIGKLEFFAKETSIDWGNATFDIYMNQGESFGYYSTPASFKEWGNKVCDNIQLKVVNGSLDIYFEVPFKYTEGDILIGVQQTAKSASDVTSTWYGVTETKNYTTANYMQRYGSTYSIYSEKFSPKVTITTTSSTIPVTLGSNGYTTFACPRPLDLTALPDGLKAYKAKVYAKEGKVRFGDIDQKVAANTGILLAGTAGETYNIPVADSGTAVEGNDFLVNSTGGTFAAEEGYTYFGFKKNSNPITFATFDPSTVAIPTNKAYLKVETLPTEARQLVAVFDDGETTGISEVRGLKSEGRYEFFNLNGQRVAQPTKGLYIVNGKKVLVP